MSDTHANWSPEQHVEKARARLCHPLGRFRLKVWRRLLACLPPRRFGVPSRASLPADIPGFTILTDRPYWISVTVKAGDVCRVTGTLLQHPEDPDARALIRIRSRDGQGKWIEDAVPDCFFSERVGTFRYLLPDPDDGVFSMRLLPPEGAHSLELGFQAWQRNEPLLLASTLRLEDGRNPAREYPRYPSSTVPSPDAVTIACVLDPFSYSCFAPEAHLVPLTPDGWKQTMDTEGPALLLVESAWRGLSDEWRGHIGGLGDGTDSLLHELIAYCRSTGIPTVFWNKEDPPNFEHFLPAARLFDHVFTTDADCVPRYREACGHDRVAALPFAAQPQIHNPVRPAPTAREGVCFAGTWYAKKHAERSALMPLLLDPAMTRGLHIYDRMYMSDSEAFRYPARYRPFIRGTLDYDQMLYAYRTHKVFLNTNSVTGSPTMFARRVFELLACGTPVISTESLGIRQLLGDFVPVVTSREETATQLDRLLEDEDAWRRHSHLSYRYIHEQHTYGRRLLTILEAIGVSEAVTPLDPPVTLLAAAQRQEDAERALRCFGEQTYGPLQLVLCCSADMQPPPLPTGVHIAPLGPTETPARALLHAATEVTDGFWCHLDPACRYGAHFVADAVLASRYVTAPVIGKQAVFLECPHSGTLALSEPDAVHCPANALDSGSLLVRHDILQDHDATPAGRDDPLGILKLCRDHHLSMHAADPFSFIRRAPTPLAPATGSAQQVPVPGGVDSVMI